MFVDLHVHSSESDGTLTPAELILLAKSHGVEVIALCDHDTLNGNAVFQSSARENGIKAIPGIEISSEWSHGSCHILGLGVSCDCVELNSLLDQIRASRNERNLEIIQKLKNYGHVIDWESVAKHAKKQIISRNHIAMEMVERGIVPTIKSAFELYLAKGKPAYVERYRLEPSKAVELLRKAGAVTVLAHPSQLHVDKEEAVRFFKSLISFGLQGLEIYTPYASDEEIETFGTVARESGLLVLGGSDFHGSNKPDHHLGFYREGKRIPQLCAENILKIINN